MVNDIILLAVLLLICGFFSATEIAFVTGNKLKIEIRARKKKILLQRSALYFTNDPRTFFSTILLGSTILNITFASLQLYYFQAYSALVS